MEVFGSIIRSFVKVLFHLVSGKCELERLTFEKSLSNQLVQRVRVSVKKSKKIPSQSKSILVEKFDPFPVIDMVQEIKRIKNFENPGLIFAVSSFRRTNISIQFLSSLASTPFQSTEEDLLKKLWNSLRPNVDLKGEIRHSESWSSIGFQGLDPSTDFRGGGILSLKNLVYFSENSGPVARRILNEQCRDITQGGFPFALTGINLTSLLLTLAVKRKIDDLFIYYKDEPTNRKATAVHNIRRDESTPLLEEEHENVDLSDEQVRVISLERFNMAYSVIFTLFSVRWREAAPRDVMGFPTVYASFKKEVEEMISTPEGMLALIQL